MTDLTKVYTPSNIEDKWYRHWLENNYFHAEPNAEKEPFTIVIPPPNVTGMLTMGHVLNNTMQDILIRKARMEGKEACWIPGTDHASIATETKVVDQLKEKGIKKEDLKRSEFLEYAWEWKRKYGGIIINQLKKLGCSCDWERERFTMDPDYSRAVLEAFVKLYHKGLIYRGHRLVNWCPVSKSAISDEEVIHREVNSKLWYFRYPVIGLDEYVVVATTRPETMLGDTAIAIHPHDDRYSHLIGKKITLPLTGREIPVIVDKFVDPAFGTGCVKVTPAHDPNDFTMGDAHDLEFINIFNEDASMNTNVPQQYQGLNRFEARTKVIEDLEKAGYLEKIEDYTHKVGYSERGQVPIEYYMSEQWYLKMSDLAKPAIETVKSGAIKFHPQHWAKTYMHWMNNIKDWCISRQLWWGHRIPVWYNGDDIYCGIEAPEGDGWVQDEDVLDTWASSWLWPLAVHDWPGEGKDLDYFYPTDVLITGPDIIFFWVARMIMAGQEFKNDLPFKDVYFTSILRDETGKKFSKSLGNSPDPFDLFDQFGTDGVRFGIMLMAPQGLDVLFSTSRLEVGRNFMNKLWNASRFVKMNLDSENSFEKNPGSLKLNLPERWILSRLTYAQKQINRRLDEFHFNEAAKAIYEFTWSDFCDWYVEIAKTRFYGDDEQLIQNAQAVSVYIIRNILTMLHPYAPFITEELWSHFKYPEDQDLIISPWLRIHENFNDEQAEKSIGTIQDIITAVRTLRSQLNIPPSKQADLVIRGKETHLKLLKTQTTIIKSLGKIRTLTIEKDVPKPEQAATAVVGQVELFLPLEGLIDFDIEKGRLEKRHSELKSHINGVEKKLANNNFVSRAPAHVVEHEQKKLADMSIELKKIRSNLEMLR